MSFSLDAWGSIHNLVRRRPNQSTAPRRGLRTKWQTDDSKADALGRIPLLAGLKRNELVQLGRHAEDLDVSAGTHLYREGDTAREFFIVVEGEVEICKDGNVWHTWAVATSVGRSH